MQVLQQEKLQLYAELLQRYNQRLNLLSRRTTEQGFRAHIQECLVFARVPFPEGSTLADWGTGGGLPAIPLAIMRPEVKVYAVDAVHKKILAVNAFKRELDLPNLYPWHGRAEEVSFQIQNSVSRWATSLRTLWSWHMRAAAPGGTLYCLKGAADLEAEQKQLAFTDPDAQVHVTPVSEGMRVLVQVTSRTLPTDRESNSHA